METRVLVVDDEEEFTDVLRERLETRGFAVSTAYSGEEAIQKLDVANPDVVILDVMLPGKDGLSTLKEIKEKLPLTGVIMLTGHGTLETAVEGMKRGAYDFLVKPMEIRTLVEKIIKAHRHKSEQEERLRNAGIEQIMGPVGDLAAGIAHEINNPVAIMVQEAGWVEDLLQELELPEGENLLELKRALKQIQTQGERCKEITHKLLTFARKTDPRIRDLQLNDLAREVLESFRTRLESSHIGIETRFDPALPPVAASPSEMRQVLLNLIGNAADAIGSKRGVITITTRIQAERVVIEVSDTGHGIPSAQITRVFDPFFTTKPTGKGTGLGLSICYGLVTKHGGDITVESELGVGSTFRVLLPIVQSEATREDAET